MSKPLIPIRNLDELKKILFIQMSITQQAKTEMLAIASDAVISSKKPAGYIANEKKLLEKYAKYPTLSEFAHNPELLQAYKWGATFGVAALVGGLILEEVRQMQPHFETVLRQMFFILLQELNDPKHTYLVEPLEKAIKANLEPVADTSKQEAKTYMRSILHRLVECFVIVSVEFGLMSSEQKGITITPTGKRILLHLADVQRFIEDLTAAHIKLQSMKPKLNLI